MTSLNRNSTRTPWPLTHKGASWQSGALLPGPDNVGFYILIVMSATEDAVAASGGHGEHH